MLNLPLRIKSKHSSVSKTLSTTSLHTLDTSLSLFLASTGNLTHIYNLIIGCIHYFDPLPLSVPSVHLPVNAFISASYQSLSNPLLAQYPSLTFIISA